jgi:N-acetylglucosaminyldiphosphoundecaprenol N-acetyl-beta-D-mannosaminyltransferase
VKIAASERSGQTRRLFGVQVNALTMEQVIAACDAAIESGDMLSIGVVNAAKIVTMRRNPELRKAVTSCDLVLADGQAVVWASRLLRQPLPERVAGIDLFERLLARAAQRGHRVFILGATDEVLADATAEALRRWPELVIAGSRNGYFPMTEADQVAAQIQASGADLLFVAMTSPKKELFLETWGPSLGVKVSHGVGGSVDVLAGKVRRAPAGWQKLGLEWLYRVKQEPGRLWKRYLVTNVSFAAMLAVELVKPAQPYDDTDLTGRRPPAPEDLQAPLPYQSDQLARKTP